LIVLSIIAPVFDLGSVKFEGKVKVDLFGS